MSIVTALNHLRRECIARGMPGPQTYAIPVNDVPAAAAEIAMVINSTKPKADHVSVEVVTRAIFQRTLTMLNCRVIVAEMVGP